MSPELFFNPESMPVLPEFLRIEGRFRKKEVADLFAGLKIIICERAGQLLNGHAKNSGYFRVLPDRRPPEADFDPELMDRISQLHMRLYAPAHETDCGSHRLRFDEVELWVLVLGVKMAAHQAGHRDSEERAPGDRKRWSRLLRKLGRMKRKARSAWLHSEYANLYESYRLRWKNFECWIQTYFGCLCRQPAIVPTRRRLFFANAVEVAQRARQRPTTKFHPKNDCVISFGLRSEKFAECERQSRSANSWAAASESSTFFGTSSKSVCGKAANSN